MDAIRSIITLAGLLVAYRQGAYSTLSKAVFGDGTKIAALKNGADLTTKRYEKALRWFSDNWPDDLDWPTNIPRPDRKGDAE